MDFKKILENKPMLYGIIGAIVLVLILSITIGVVATSHSDGGNGVVKEKKIKEPLDLLTTDNIGKAIEIQALLARQGIEAQRRIDGTKSTIYLQNYTPSQRDEAYLAIVKSGLVDQNIGLEIFDKGDFTSTKEDKRIRLARAINGELSRLIRKIPPIENASVFISIPEQSMFTTMQKPVTATVQITIPSGDKLDALKVKAITNLLLGSISGLEAENISITDTNGNVYSSIIDSGDEMTEKSKENDKYMQQKINAQLDKLIGKGNYVVTVSTFLRQSPIETSSINYDPNRKTSVTEQVFKEGLGDRSAGTSTGNAAGGAVSVSLPRGVQGYGGGMGSGSSSQNRNYERSAVETQYGVSKTQTNEYTKAGAIEEVSVAVTLEKKSLPPETTLDELKELIANAAGPKVDVDNVTIALADTVEPYLAGDKPANLPVPNETGNPWWLAVAAIVIGLTGGLKYLSGRIKASQEKQKEVLMHLEEKAHAQEQQIRDVNLKAAELIEKQNQMAQGLLEQKQRIEVPVDNSLTEAIEDISADINEADEEEVGEKIKSWIEKA
ncbi:MAG: hypothetical protein MJ229_05615 [bacterium]|nr:hypothetical protein [bacterium]